MASGYVPQVQKVAGMGIVEREMTTEGSNDIYLEEHHPRSMDKNGSDISMKSTTDVENHAPAQPRGVADMEAVTVIWTKNWLIAAYATIMLISFINSLQQQTNYAFRPYVVSAFQKHGLTAMTDVVANIVGGVSKLPLAKFIDLVGRPQGFLVCMVSVVLALVLMAVCQNVQTFCAAQVFYWAGMNGIDYVQNIFIADTSLMQNRLIWMALTGLPYVVNTFAGPSLGETFLDHSTWRWGYGTFAIITPIVSMSFWAVFWLMGRRAKKLGVMKREKSSRTVMQSIRHWCIEFDGKLSVIGLLLICGGFSVFLLPFSLAGYQQEGFASPMIICMIVFGLLIIGLFLVWERFYAPRTFFPFKLMKDRSVIAACFLGANSWIAFYSYKMYYSSYLQVVFNLSVAKAGYITNIFFIVSCTWALIISFAFKYTDTYKWGAIIAMPVQILMTGLLIHFREPGTSIGYLVMVEVFGAMASAMLLQIEQVAIMVAVPHEDIAVGLALLSVITAVGGAIGQSVSGALWNQIVPDKIAEYLPEASQDRIMEIFGDLNVQLALPWGSPEREALIKAFADAQKTMLIVGTCALVPCFVWVAMLKNSRMSDRMARKGLQA
ncbi:siderophore iron transporter mirB [Decorospora gaudefroyi]|uniref:Siderophore iron transporter mirB n=1 Tax=Decorospora gaudefroyi TaxID=184978 RepID=A0A6A5KVZ3_9PLEO|nr:siderophore iron transporter mirB [Decorospora gaudefroyi]